MTTPVLSAEPVLGDDDLLDLDAWDAPDRLSLADSLVETGCDALRGRPALDEDDDR